MLRAGIGDIHLSGYQSDPIDTNGLTTIEEEDLPDVIFQTLTNLKLQLQELP